MARHSSVLMGQVRYSADLSYQQLMELENEYIQNLKGLLEHYGAEDLDFWGQDDALQLEAQIKDASEGLMRELCDALCTLLQNGSTGRLLVIDRDLRKMELYHLGLDSWRHERIEIGDAYYRRAFQGHGPE